MFVTVNHVVSEKCPVINYDHKITDRSAYIPLSQLASEGLKSLIEERLMALKPTFFLSFNMRVMK